MPKYTPLLKSGEEAFKQPLHIPNVLEMFKTAQAGSQAQAEALTQSPLYQQAQAATGQLAGGISKGLSTISAPIFNQPLNKRIVDTAMSPVTTFATPALEKAGVPSSVAAGIGFVGDILATPGGKAKAGESVFKGFADLTTKILERLKGKSFVSRQFISDLTNASDLKQPERDLVRNVLDHHDGQRIDVNSFANKIKTELLPLDRLSHEEFNAGNTRYENITLPDELRGPIADYSEHIYNSPIQTSASEIHFNSADNAPYGYFAHSRVEDLPSIKIGEKFDNQIGAAESGPYKKGDTRRVIELQSDLFQKGNLENERPSPITDRGYTEKQLARGYGQKAQAQYEKQFAQLAPYRNTWHERLIREEVKQAAIDGKTKLQFPTGETAMKIEGLGDSNSSWFRHADDMDEAGFRTNGTADNLTPENMKVGDTAYQGNVDSPWIITDVLGDGKFKAMPKEHFDSFVETQGVSNLTGQDLISYAEQHATKNFWGSKETFDISGKVDTENPIYKFYEKEVGRYLKNKYNATLVTDPQGVKWWEVAVPKEAKRSPIEAFALAPFALPPTQVDNKN